MQNEYAQIAPATIALQEAVKQLNSVKKEYEQYKNEKSNLQTKLNELKQRYKNKEVGINASDIEDLSDILDNIKDEERYYITNVALATTNVASKTTALISQIAAASVSSGTYGFSVGVAANISGTQTNTKNKQTISSPSNLNALNIRLTTNKDKESSTNITGSNLLANNNIDINTKDLNINSSQDRFESDENSKSLSGSAKFTMYGGGGGSLGLDHSQSNSYSESIINNNSKLISNKDININTTNDTTIKGANLRADGTLNLKVGNNLSLESLRDKYTSNQKDFSISAGVGFSGNTIAKSNGITTTGLFDKNHFVDINTIDKSSTNANFSRSRSNTITKQTILSSITANELNVEVGKNTHLKGSLLAAGEYDKDNTFIDNHNLNLKTNTLSYENLSNTSYAKGTNFSIGANYILEDKNNKDSKSNNNQEDKFTGLKSIDLSNHRNLSYSLSKNLATLGSGNIEIADKQNSDDLTRLNRDTTKLTKDLVNTSISSNVDASMDLRVVTKSGQKDIKDEFNTATAITKALNAIMETGEFNFNSEVKENYNTYQINKALGNELVNILQNDNLSINEKENFLAEFTKDLAKSNGYDLGDIQVKFINDTNAIGANNEKFRGNYNSKVNVITLNLANISNLEDFTDTLGHEITHAIAASNNKFIPQDAKQDIYANFKGSILTDYLKKALGTQGNDIDLLKSNVNLDYENTDIKNILSNNQAAFSLQDMSQSDNNKYLHIIGIGILTIGKSIKNIVTKGGKNAKNATENKVPENPLNKANEAQKVDKVTKVADNKDIDFDKILENAEKGRKTSTKLIQYEKEGGYKQAEKDFEALGVKNIKTVEKSDGSLVKIGELSDGRKVNIRTKSTYGSEATLEIQGKEPIKIRYK